MSRCLYCKCENPDSLSHIIPEAFCNDGPVIEDAVCRECNTSINNEIENRIIRALSLISNDLGLKGKRRRPHKVRVVAEMDNNKIPLYVSRYDELKDKVVAFKSPAGINFLGPFKELEKKKSEYEKKHPKTKWAEKTVDMGHEVKFTLELDLTVLGEERALRLASKIAFEWLCKQKGSSDLFDGHEYDAIRNFVRYGTTVDYPVASVVTEPHILEGLGNLPYGFHSIFISYNASRREIIAVVGLFGLVLYKVVLTQFYSVIANGNMLFSIHPQTGNIYEPVIRQHWRDPDLMSNTEFDRIPPMEALRRLTDDILSKLDSFNSRRKSD